MGVTDGAIDGDAAGDGVTDPVGDVVAESVPVVVDSSVATGMSGYSLIEYPPDDDPWFLRLVRPPTVDVPSVAFVVFSFEGVAVEPFWFPAPATV